MLTYCKSKGSQASYYLQDDEDVSEADLMAPSWFVTGAHGNDRQAWGLRDGVQWSYLRDAKASFIHLARGWHPSGSHALARNHAQHARVALHDFTFSAPKSVSVAWGLADAGMATRILTAQVAAVRLALDTLARLALTRLGKGGAIKLSAELCGALFTHGTSRDGDPQVHTHAVAFNLVQREDGRSSALETKELLRLQGLAANVYVIELAARMQHLCFHVVPTKAGRSFELLDIPEHVRHAFSKRRQDLLERADTYFPGAEQRPNAVHTRAARRRMAALVDRPCKRIEPAHVQHARWADEAGEHGLSWSELLSIIQARRARMEHVFRDDLLERAQRHVLALMSHQSWVSAIQLEQEVTAAMMGLCDASEASSVYEEIVDALLDRRDVTAFNQVHEGWVLKAEYQGGQMPEFNRVFQRHPDAESARQQSRSG